MKASYFPNIDFPNATVGINPSYLWRSIIESQGVIKQRCRKKIGDGKDTRVWQVPWLPCLQNGYLMSVMHEELEHVTVHIFMEDNHGKMG